jgi:hypothetical protein
MRTTDEGKQPSDTVASATDRHVGGASAAQSSGGLGPNEVLALQRTAGNAAVARLLSRAPARLQRAYVYLHIQDTIGGSKNSDEYYEGLGFQKVRSLDGHWVWADPRNVDRVGELSVPPWVLQGYEPTPPPAMPGGAAADGPARSPSRSTAPAVALQAATAQLERGADKLEPILRAAPATATGGSAAKPAAATKPGMRKVNMAALRVPTHSKPWQKRTPTAERLALLREAVQVALAKWTKVPPDELCVLTAPEYLFALQSDESHFMSKKDYTELSKQLDEVAGALPKNVLFIPGTIGWSQLASELPAAAEAKSKAETASESSGGSAEQLADVLRQLDEAHVACRSLSKTAVSKELESEWRTEKEQAKGATAADVKLVYNTALVHFQGVAKRYDKMFESVEGALDRMSDKQTLFMHGSAPFSDVFMDVRVSLEICSDYASDAAKALKMLPSLQLVLASNYGSAEGGLAGQHLLLADSVVTTSYDVTQADDAPQEVVPILAGKEKGLLHFSSNTLKTA